MAKITIKRIDSFALATAAAVAVFVLSAIGSVLALLAQFIGNSAIEINIIGVIQAPNPGVLTIIFYPFVSGILTWVLASVLVGAINFGLRISGGLDVYCDAKHES